MELEEFVDRYPLTSVATAFLAGFTFTSGKLGKFAVGQAAGVLGPAGAAVAVAATALPRMARQVAGDSVRNAVRRAKGG